MCGIAGFLNRHGEPASALFLHRMTDAIAHRGPDGEGYYTEGVVALGHRRLAIIDLSPAGHQPMLTPEGRYVLTYNGEIYNYQELRLQLEARGYSFRSRTDSEVVLYGYAEWGAGLLEKLNGMFAFAIWDTQRQVLFMARDRYGIKPLYYADLNGVFLFGSEVKAILAHPAYQARLDSEALIEYFTFQNFFTDRTLFADVRLLPAASCVEVSAEGGVSLMKFWDYQFQEPESPASEGEYLEELDRLFQQAVNRQLYSDVPMGAYLSGGMDSGSITALASRQIPYIQTFTVGFDLNSASGMELGFDERQQAEYMSYLFKTEHYEMVLKAGDMERIMPQLVRHLEEPRVGQSYPNFYAARLASKFVKVCLSGAGGDELFGGYPWRYQLPGEQDSLDAHLNHYAAFWQRLIPTEHIKTVFQPLDAVSVSPIDIFKKAYSADTAAFNRPEDYVNQALSFEARTFLQGLLLVEDKLSMAHGLEVRVPFLDNDLVDFAMRLPVRLKLNLYERSGRSLQGKRLLRQAMQRHIPTSITELQKQGFSAPDASWFKGESIDYVRRRLFNPRARIYEYLDSKAIQSLLSDHLEGRENRRLLIWSLLYFEEWCEQYLGKVQNTAQKSLRGIAELSAL